MHISVTDCAWICVGIVFMTLQQAEAKRCMRNDDIGWREGNVYYCEDPVLSECCEQNRQFTCCEYVGRKTIREQLQLWGAISLFCLTLAAIYLYYRRDSANPCCPGHSGFSGCRTIKHAFSSQKGKSARNSQYAQDDSEVQLTATRPT